VGPSSGSGASRTAPAAASAGAPPALAVGSTQFGGRPRSPATGGGATTGTVADRRKMRKERDSCRRRCSAEHRAVSVAPLVASGGVGDPVVVELMRSVGSFRAGRDRPLPALTRGDGSSPIASVSSETRRRRGSALQCGRAADAAGRGTTQHSGGSTHEASLPVQAPLRGAGRLRRGERRGAVSCRRLPSMTPRRAQRLWSAAAATARMW